MHKGLLDREPLRPPMESSISGIRLIKGAQRVFLWRFYRFTRAKRGNIEMVKCIGKFSLLLKRLRDAWMDMLPLSIMSEERRQNQYLTDVAQENAERQTRGVNILDPNAQATRDRWNATEVSNHEKLFQFSDNLTTLIFLVVSDLSEAQRETHKFLSLRECPC